jgi:hypothetical protein
MNAIDILYTPLDLPPCPEIDIAKLRNWIEKTYPQTNLLDLTEGVVQAHNSKGDKYPWDFTFAKLYSWQNNFDKEFPELAKYAIETFEIAEDEIIVLAILPIRDSTLGVGFWHADPDLLGLRFYVLNESYKENEILIKEAYPNIPSEDIIGTNFTKDDPRLIHKAVVAENIHPRQPFYLNNLRAAHSIINTVKSERIAILLGTAGDDTRLRDKKLDKKFNDLVVRSAYKFHEQAIFANDWSTSIKQQN